MMILRGTSRLSQHTRGWAPKFGQNLKQGSNFNHISEKNSRYSIYNINDLIFTNKKNNAGGGGNMLIFGQMMEGGGGGSRFHCLI